MKKVFFNDKYIAFRANNCSLSIDEPNTRVVLNSYAELPRLLNNFLSFQNKTNLVVECNDEDETFVAFCDMFDMIFAGGGLVSNSKNEILFIYRHNRWDLPKGKQEKGESIDTTAVREVEEECNISKVKIGNFIAETYHCFFYEGRIKMKRTFWYEMFYEGPPPSPQTEEDIEIARFISKDEQAKCIDNTYASIREVFIAAKLY